MPLNGHPQNLWTPFKSLDSNAAESTISTCWEKPSEAALGVWGKEIPTAVSNGAQRLPPCWMKDWPEKAHLISTTTTFSSASQSYSSKQLDTWNPHLCKQVPKTSEKVPEKASLNELQCFLESFHTLPSASMGHEYDRILKSIFAISKPP